jgi:hypothetical protein
MHKTGEQTYTLFFIKLLLEKARKGRVLTFPSRVYPAISTSTRLNDGFPLLILSFSPLSDFLILSRPLGLEKIVLLDIVLFDSLQFVQTSLNGIGLFQGML